MRTLVLNMWACISVVAMTFLIGCSKSESQNPSGTFVVGQWVPAWDGQFRGRINPNPPRPPDKTRCRGRVLYYPGDRPSNTVGSVPVNQIFLKGCFTEGKTVNVSESGSAPWKKRIWSKRIWSLWNLSGVTHWMKCKDAQMNFIWIWTEEERSGILRVILYQEMWSKTVWRLRTQLPAARISTPGILLLLKTRRLNQKSENWQRKKNGSFMKKEHHRNGLMPWLPWVLMRTNLFWKKPLFWLLFLQEFMGLSRMERKSSTIMLMNRWGSPLGWWSLPCIMPVLWAWHTPQARWNF